MGGGPNLSIKVGQTGLSKAQVYRRPIRLERAWSPVGFYRVAKPGLGGFRQGYFFDHEPLAVQISLSLLLYFRPRLPLGGAVDGNEWATFVKRPSPFPAGAICALSEVPRSSRAAPPAAFWRHLLLRVLLGRFVFVSHRFVLSLLLNSRL